MDYVGAALTSIGLLKDFWPSISKCFNYGKILEKNLTILHEKLDRLKSRETDVKIELEKEQYHRKRAREEVENWLKEVQRMKDVVERMEREVAKRRCFSRLGFLREWEENIEKAGELVERANFPNGILIDVKNEGIALLTKELIGESTAKQKLEEIWTCLEKGEVRSIGVWGMGGVGKTTLVTHINNRLLENKDAFGVVYWVTVSGDSSIQRLQDAIAGKIDLDLSKEKDEMIRQARLFEKLQGKRKFVLIFDDVWEVYPPEEIGIPIGADAGTLIVTSRSREVLQKMGCKEFIKVDSLDKKEAWELFDKMLNRHGGLDPNEEEIAKDVVKECGGLPLAIVTIARSLSVVYDIAEWRSALNELREHVKGLTIDMENGVFKRLEFSYHRLNDDKIQECLLYCALFPEDFTIRRLSLIRYWFCEGLIEKMGSRQAERDRGHAILNKLENACLLERCEDGKAVRMHDVIRDMAINIARNNSRFMVKTRRNQEDLSSEMLWSSNLERVSLFDSKISSLMFEPNCPKLSTMVLQSCKFPKDVRESFFMHMTGLRVLDLSYTSIGFLADFDLGNLRALILRGCWKLKHVGSLKKLKELKMLDFSETGIETIPDGIDKLVSLKEFYWTVCSSGSRPYCQNGKECRLAVLDSLPKLLSNLVHLQCLILLDERVRDFGAEELGRLTKLEILCTKFSSLPNFNSYIRTQHYRILTHYYVNLVRKHIHLGWGTKINWYCKQVRVTESNVKGRRKDTEGQLVLPTDLQALCLERCDLHALPWDLLPCLNKVIDLEEYIERSCFSSLKHLEVIKRYNLKHLFTAGLVKYHLQNLVTIIVNNCSEMEEIIQAAIAEEEEEILSLSNLERLELVSLPELKSIWKGTMTCDSLQQLTVMDCPKLRRLPISVHVSDGESRASNPPLQLIQGESKWWDGVEWDTHPAAKSLFEPLILQHSEDVLEEEVIERFELEEV